MKRARVQASVAIGVAFAVGAGIAGCEGLLGLGDPTVIADGGGPSDASSPPAESAPPVDGAIDATADTNVVDAAGRPETSPGADAGDASHAPDASDAGIYEPSLPCAQQGNPVFCADFDSVAAVGDGWSYAAITVDGGVIAFDTTAGEYTSSPRSAKVVDPVQHGNVQLAAETSAFSSWVHLAFDLRVDPSGLSGDMKGIAQVCVAQLTANFSLDYVIDGQPAAYVQEYPEDGGEPTNLKVPIPPLGAWTRIVMVYDVANGTSIYQNGVLVASDESTAGAPILDAQEIFGGAFINPPGTKTLTVEVDNVVVRGE